tara:strand:+ start:1154 stop:1540 length:387 start_codon:yes stop_codon:yes gene_type:complete
MAIQKSNYSARSQRASGDGVKKYKKSELDTKVSSDCVMTTTVIATGKVNSTIKLNANACARAKGTATKEQKDAYASKMKTDKPMYQMKAAYATALDKATPAQKQALRRAKEGKKYLTEAQIKKVLAGS